MKLQAMFGRVVLFGFALVAAGLQVQSAQPIPHLERRGAATQLIVDGKPYLALAGETANTASSSLEYMEPVWPRLVRMNLNTVLVAVAWDWIEPMEGRYDFTLVDGLLAGARKNNLHVMFLWFGSWKNGISSFVPAWVKSGQDRFPRVQIKSGKSIEVLSTFSAANLDADTRAYTAFMKHLREVDSERQTVVMIQMQNEVGILGDSRDRSAAAEAAFAGPVPQEMMSYLQKNRDLLYPELLKRWGRPDSRPSEPGRRFSARAWRPMRSSWPGIMRATLTGSPGPARPSIRCRCSRTRGLCSRRTTGRVTIPAVVRNPW